MYKLDQEFEEKYQTIKEESERIFPEGKYHIEVKFWEDDTFTIWSIHNRVERRWKYCCQMAIGSEDSSLRGELQQVVLYYDNGWEDENTVEKNVVWKSHYPFQLY